MKDKPTLCELIAFKTLFGSINIFKELLLQDDNGAVTDVIKDQYQLNVFLINQEIMKTWLQGKEMKPVDWSTLVLNVLNKISFFFSFGEVCACSS